MTARPPGRPSHARERLNAEALAMLDTLDTGQRAAVFRELRRQGMNDQRAENARWYGGVLAPDPFVIEAWFGAATPTRMYRAHLPDAMSDAARISKSEHAVKVQVLDGGAVVWTYVRQPAPAADSQRFVELAAAHR